MPSLFTSESLTLSVLQMLQLPLPELNSFKISNFSFLSHCFLLVRTQGEFFLFSSHDFFFFLYINFFKMDLWLIRFRCVYPCVIGFPCAVLFDNFVLFGFTIPVQCIIFWSFMALICFENLISFCFNQWSLRPQILWSLVKRLSKAFVLKVHSLLSLLIMLAIFFRSC